MANRTKHKPANSEQAARLLGEQPVFLSFDDASRALLPGSDSSPPPADSSISLDGIDPEFQNILRHLTKKDSNTKSKALQYVVQFCNDKDAETLEKTVSHWQRMYRKLSNSTDSKIRLEAHVAHKSFISKLKTETVHKLYSVKTEDAFDIQMSFQKLVTLPAVLWTSCCDQSTQPAEAARAILNHIYPTPEDKLQFLITNHLTILHFCVYTLFHKIPVDLFYSTTLSKDAREFFDQHLLVTTFMGLSTLINELLCPEDRQGECEKCLRTIFHVINREFLKSKQVLSPSQAGTSGAPSTSSDSGKEKEKKKPKKKPDDGKHGDTEKEGDKGFKFWTYEKVENFSVRSAFYSFLNSLTRLTTRLLQDTEVSRPDADGTILWFKLYKNVFLSKVFFAFSDSVAQVRGNAWLLVTHILLNHQEYKPWTVVSHEKWKKDILLPFIENGCKPREGIMDFGLINIVKKSVFPELFSKKFINQSAFKMICDSYSLTNVVENVRLITVFADAYQESFDVEKEDVYATLISALSVALSKAFLLSDAKFLDEVYFNLIYHFVIRNSFVQNIGSLTKKFEQIFCVDMKKLFFDSFRNSQDILSNSHMSLNLLVLARNVSNDHRLNPVSFSRDVFELFKSNILQLYSEILSYSSHWLEKPIQSKDYSGFKNYLKSLNFLFFLHHDGYFSCEYYYLRASTDYTKNFMNIFKSRCATEQTPKEKKVQFQVESDEKPTSQDSDLSPEDTAFGHVSLFNPSFSNFKADSRAYLPDDFQVLFEKFSVTMAKLFKKFDQEFLNGLNECSMILLYHLQYYYRIFEFVGNQHFLRELGIEAIDQFIENYLLKWVRSVVDIICKKENFTTFKLEMTILQKLFDCIFIAAPSIHVNDRFWSDFFSKMDSFVFILFIEHLDKLKKHPFSIRYEQRLNSIRLNINESIYLHSLETEVDKILAGQVSKIQLINMTKLLNIYLSQCEDSVKLEDSFNMLCNIAKNNCFEIPQANWYHARMACIFLKIVERIDIKEIDKLDRFSTNLTVVLKYLLNKCFIAECSADFTCEQFTIVLNFVQFAFNLCPLFGPKFVPILEDFFSEITKPTFYSDNPDRLDFMEKVFNATLGCLRILPETLKRSEEILIAQIDGVTAEYRDDITPVLFATEVDDSELKLLAFYEVLASDRFCDLLKSDFMSRIKFNTINNHFQVSFFFNQSLILNRLLAQFHKDQVEELLDNPSGTILDSLKNLFKVYFYFEHAVILPMSQNCIKFDKQKALSINIEFGLFIEQLSSCIETITNSDPDLKIKLFGFLVDIHDKHLKNILLSYVLNNNFFFLEFSEIFEFFEMDTNEFGLMMLNFLENREYDHFFKNFESFSVKEGENTDKFKHQQLTSAEHQRMLFMCYALIWETAGSEQDMARRLKNINDYMNTTKLFDFIKNNPSEKAVSSLFAKVVSEISVNSLRQIRDFQIFYDMISCLVEIVQKCIFEQGNCLDFFLSSRVLKALIDCNQEICKSTCRMPILDWKMFASNIANNIILRLVFQLREFVPENFIQDVFYKRLAHTVEWIDDQTMRLCKDFNGLNVGGSKKLELEARLDNLIVEQKLTQSSFSPSKTSRKNMETGSAFHDTVLSSYFGVLFHPNLQWTLAAYHVLSKTLQDLNRVMPDDSTTVAQESGDSEIMAEDQYLEPFKVVVDYLRKLNAATHVVFDEYEFAEEVLLEPETDVYDYSLAYLLVWKLYLELIDSFNSNTTKAEQVRNSLIEFITNNELHETLLQVLYHLMMNVEENLDPKDDDYLELFSAENIEATFKQLDQISKFSDLTSIFRNKHISLLPRLAQVVYYQCLKTLPGIVRLWAGKQKKPDRELIDGFTVKYFTTPLISSEYDRFHGEKDFGNISVRFNKRDKDIFLVYNRNEISLKIKFSFPANYPLTQLSVDCLDHSGATEEQTKDWIHRIIIFFSKHNCSVKDAIVMLKPNMDKFFENFEECMICLFMLQGVNKELPRLRCPQCRKKFHRTCMDRWFRTSNLRTCPQCKYEFKIGI